MTQTINQSQYPPSASTTFVPNNLDYVLYADQFAVGSDIGAQVNAAIASVPCSSSGSQSIVIKLPANQFLTQTTTIQWPVCAGGTVNPIRYLDGSGSILNYTGTGDAILIPFSSSGMGRAPSAAPPFGTAVIRDLQIWCGTTLVPCTVAQNGIHIQDGIGTLLQNVALWYFSSGCGIEWEDIGTATNSGYFTEWTKTEDASFGANLHSICYINNATTPGTGSFLYHWVTNPHFQLTDGEDAFYVNGNNQPGGAQLSAATIDEHHNITVTSAGANIFNFVNGGSMIRSNIIIRGEVTGGNSSVQSCVFNQGDIHSGFNTYALDLQSGITENCSSANSYSNASSSHAVNGLMYFQPENGAGGQGRQSKRRFATGLYNGFYTYSLTGADAGIEAGWQVTTKNNLPASSTPVQSAESDEAANTGDNPVQNRLDVEPYGVGIGGGFRDFTTGGYDIASLICSGTSCTATLTQPLNNTLSGATASISGFRWTNPDLDTIPGQYVHVNGTATSNTVTYAFTTPGSVSVSAQPGTNCNGIADCAGSFYLINRPSGTAITNGLTLGAQTANSASLGNFIINGSKYTQLATFVTASYNPGSITAGTCVDKNVPATGGVSGVTVPATTDIPLSVISSNALGNVSVTGAKTTTAGDVTLHFCAVGSWTPVSSIYTVVMIH